MDLLYRWFWYLIPANPIVTRVVQGGSRRARHLWVRMVYLGVLVLLVLIGLLSRGGLASNVNITDLAKAGTQVFALISRGQVILICLLAPIFFAGAINQQRAGETFDILLTTPLTNLQIVLGMMMSRLFFVLALLVSGLPLFAVLLIFGGVPIGSVFVAFATAGFTALTVGSIAVTLSVMRTGGRKAVFVFVISVAGALLASYMLDVFLLRRITPIPNSSTWMTPLHPLLVLEASMNTANYKPPSAELLGDYPPLVRFYLSRPFASYCLLSLLVSALMMTWSAVQVRRIGAGGVPWWKRLLRLSTPGERRRPPRHVWNNPVAWREASTRGSRGAAFIARYLFAGGGVLLGALLILLHHLGKLPPLKDVSGVTMSPSQVFHVMLFTLLTVELAIIVMVAVFMSAGAVSREREDGTLDLMLTTPITPRFYIWGKLRGLVSFLTVMLAVPVLTMLMASAYTIAGQQFGWAGANAQSIVRASHVRHELVIAEAPVLLALTLVPFVALCVMIGMNWSLKAKGVLGAVIPSVSVIGVLALVLGFCGWMMSSEVPYVGPAINAFSPVGNLAMIVNPWERVSGFTETAVARAWLLIAALIAGGGYSLIVYTMLLGMVRGFDQTVRRLSGTG